MVPFSRISKSLILSVAFVGLPLFSPVDNNDGTVTDDRGLMWLQDSHPALGSTEVFLNWQEAMEWVDTLNTSMFAGHGDWRLPSALDFETGIPDLLWNSSNNEFGHLYMVSLSNPASQADIVPMIHYPWASYWTSTQDPGNDTKAAAFFWSYDGLGLNQMLPKSTELRYTAVRGLEAPERASECNDTYDNDSDGDVDFPADWGCYSVGDDTEEPLCFEISGRTLCLIRCTSSEHLGHK